MPTMVSRTASSERIHAVGKKTLAAAQARGGEVKTLAEARLAPAVGALDENEGLLMKALEADAGAHAALMARDSESDLEIGTVFDEIWNAMGRPSQSIDYQMIVSGGKKDWCSGDPTKQAALMAVLAKQIRTSKHAKLGDKKETWAARIEQRAAAQAEAARPAEASYAQIAALKMQRRSLADAVQVALVRFKRDLMNLGMTEAQAHEIIPDSPRSSGPAQVAPAPASKPATPSTPAT